MCESLTEALLPILTDAKYREFQQYFIQRVRRQQVKRCHGDLKARNIWITSSPSHQGSEHSEIWSGVRVLDAVDFNPEFCNIDTLSDFAMLVADIHARTDSSLVLDNHVYMDPPNFVKSMIEDYLCQTKQEDIGSRFVLNYYLVEKAFVGALVSILYDGNLGLGRAFLEVTQKYLHELQFKLDWQHIHWCNHINV